jgi:hypothetical protein
LPELLIAIAILGMMMAAVFGVLDISQKSYTRSSSMEEMQTGVRGVMDRLATELRLLGSEVVGAENTAIAAADVASFISSAATDPTAVISGVDMTATRIRFRGDVDGNSLNSNTDVTATGAVTAAGTTVTVNALGSAFNSSRRLYIASGTTREVRPITSVSSNTITITNTFANAYPVGAIVRSIEDVIWEYCAATKDVRRLQIASTATNATLCGTAPSGTETLLTGVEAMTFTYYDVAGTAIAGGTLAAALQMREIEVTITVSGTAGYRRALKFRVQPRSLQLV